MNTKKEDKTTQVYVGNLPSELTEDDLMKSINSEKVKLLRLCRNGIKTFCFLDCGSQENAAEFFRSMNGVEIMGRKMCVRLFEDNSAKREQTKQQLSRNDKNGFSPRHDNFSFHSSSELSDKSNEISSHVMNDKDEKQLKSVNDYDKPPPLRPINGHASNNDSPKFVSPSNYNTMSPHEIQSDLKNDKPPPLRHVDGHTLVRNDGYSFIPSPTCHAASCVIHPSVNYVDHPTYAVGPCPQHKCHHGMHDKNLFHHEMQLSKNYISPPISEQHYTNQKSNICMQEDMFHDSCKNNIRMPDGPHLHEHQMSHNCCPNREHMSGKTSYSKSCISLSVSERKDFSFHQGDTRSNHNQFQNKKPLLPTYSHLGPKHLASENKPVESSQQYHTYGKETNYPESNEHSNFPRSNYSHQRRNFHQNGSFSNPMRENVSARMQKLSLHPQNFVKLPNKNVSKDKYSSDRLVLNNDQSSLNNQESERKHQNDGGENPVILSVANFPYGTTEEMIYNLFEDFNPIEIIMVCNYPSDQITEALVKLPNSEAATHAIIELDNTLYKRRLLVVSDIGDNILQELQSLNNC